MTIAKPVAPHSSAGPAPVRRANSVRRTSSIDTDWPEGRDGPMHMVGRARDVRRGPHGQSDQVVGSGRLEITASPNRQILTITTAPEIKNSQTLVGVRAGSQSRAAIEALLTESERSSPLSLLLDDFAGASLVAGLGLVSLA